MRTCDQARADYQYLQSHGAELFTAVCLPKADGKFPTVIMRVPYVDAEETLPEEEICRNALSAFGAWLDHGYAVVYQHCRGRGKSSGDCIPYLYEREDGLRLQDWIRKQPFYNGELYLYGRSYKASVHFVTAPFAQDIKGAVLEVQDCERYNCNYRNGFYKIGLHGGWYVGMYKHKSMPEKNYTAECFHMLPLSDFSQKIFGEKAEDFDEILRHPRKDDPFWLTRFGGGEAHDAIKHANIPILLVTGHYDIYTGGVFDMWNTLDAATRAKSALAVHPYDHGGKEENQPIRFEQGNINQAFEHFPVNWCDSVRGKCEPPFARGKVTYYKAFAGQWCCDDFGPAEQYQRIGLGTGEVSYVYDPHDPATFRGGLSANFKGTAWQDPPNLRSDIITVYTPTFTRDMFVKGKIRAKLTVKSDCEDTCFYMRLSLCKPEGDYGLRDDINQISNFRGDYVPGSEVEMEFFFDEHTFVIKAGEKLRIDISSSAFPHYVRHTNHKGLFSQQTTAKTARNTVILERSTLEIPVGE